jgi:hypothetical protein
MESVMNKKRKSNQFNLMGIPTLLVFLYSTNAIAGPEKLLFEPASQDSHYTCQSYSIGVLAAFLSNSGVSPTNAAELRAMELSLRKKIETNAVAAGRPSDKSEFEDWKLALEQHSSNKLTLKAQTFANWDDTVRFIASKTGISRSDNLPAFLLPSVVKTPVMLSFKKIEASDYTGSSGAGTHVATVFGTHLPLQTMGEDAVPELLILNSAVKWGTKYGKNMCVMNNLTDRDPYQAHLIRTTQYIKYKHPGGYLVRFVDFK